MHLDHNITRGTVGGTLIALIAAIDAGDVIKTIVLATIGAIVSFTVSKLMRWCWEKYKR